LIRRHRAAALLALAAMLVACNGAAGPTGSVTCVAPVDGVLTITATSHRFDAACLALPAGDAVTIRLVNDDTESHNVAIYTDAGKGTELFLGDVIQGGEAIDYEIDPLDPGTYYFECTVHPDMNGSVVVE
jgi:plastocyanin